MDDLPVTIEQSDGGVGEFDEFVGIADMVTYLDDDTRCTGDDAR